MNTNKRIQTTMNDRLRWLKGWIAMRNYEIGQKRNDFLCIYYSTMRMLYSSERAKKLLCNTNNKFPLGCLPAKDVLYQKVSAEDFLFLSGVFAFIGLQKNDGRYRTPPGLASISFPSEGKWHRSFPQRPYPRSNRQRYWGCTSTSRHQAHREQAHKQEVLSGNFRLPQS